MFTAPGRRDTRAVWEERTDRVRRDVVALAVSGAGVAELHGAAGALVQRVVPADLACWAAIDPQTLVISSMVPGTNALPPQLAPALAAAEYSGPSEPHRFADMARSGRRVALHSELARPERERSRRATDVWRPLGLNREVRTVLLADGACWGGVGMVRSGPDFSDREVDFLAAVSSAVAVATRLAVRAHPPGGVPHDPAVAVVGADGAPLAMTAAAREWQQLLDDGAPGRFLILMAALAAGAWVHGTARTRVQSREGGWVLLHGSRLLGDERQTAVVIETATGAQLLGLLLTAFALTAREREVCREVLAGSSTTDIARHLAISPYTVQDHLKAVFAKTETRSRGELVARLQPAGTP